MFAVIKAGGKQYKVVEGDAITINRMLGEPGDKITLSDVIALGGDEPKFGAPLVDGAAVEAEIVGHGKGDKIIIFKKSRRKHYRRKNGHRQHETTLKITGITASGAKKAEKKEVAKPAAKPAVKEDKAAKPAAAKAEAKPAKAAAAKDAPAKETKKPAAKKAAPKADKE